MKRTILSVLSGVVTIAILAFAGDFGMHQVAPAAFDATGFSSDSRVLIVMLIYTALSSAIGGWVTASVSVRADQRDVRILAILQFLMTLAANIMLWDRRLVWFYAATLIVTPVAILIAGRARQSRRT